MGAQHVRVAGMEVASCTDLCTLRGHMHVARVCAYQTTYAAPAGVYSHNPAQSVMRLHWKHLAAGEQTRSSDNGAGYKRAAMVLGPLHGHCAELATEIDVVVICQEGENGRASHILVHRTQIIH